MQFKLSTNIPHQVVVALSGGPDSVFAVQFLLKGRRNIELAYFHHGTAHADDALAFVSSFAKQYDLLLSTGFSNTKLYSEEEMRAHRYSFLRSLGKPVITGHNEDDLVETYIHGVVRNGHPRFIPKVNDQILRPFLYISKKEMRDYCLKHNHEFLDDPSNTDLRYTRNRIRHEIIPQMELINPGLRKMIVKQHEGCRSPNSTTDCVD